MEFPPNGFKRALAQERPHIGLWLGLADSYSAEICAGAGFDWLLVDSEHAPNDITSILRQLQVLAAYPVDPVVRCCTGMNAEIKQLLDIGAQTLLVPMVDTAEQAEGIVAATRYPPRGVRGVGSGLARAARWNRIGEYFAHADSEVCVIAQIESRRGVENISDIAAVDGIDALFLGSSDLAASLGHLGRPGADEVWEVAERAVAHARAAGKPVGSLSADVAAAERFLRAGCTFVAVGTDISLLVQASTELREKFEPASVAERAMANRSVASNSEMPRA